MFDDWRRTADDPGSPSPVLRLLSLLTFLVILCFLAITYADADLWGNLAFGRDIVLRGVHTSDPFSFTSDKPWVNHEWLSEVVMWAAYGAGGAPGLVALKLSLVAAAGALLLRWWAAFRMPRTWRDGLLFAVALGVWPLVATVRSQAFSIALFAFLLFALARVRGGARGWLFALPALFAVWVNVHGGWLVGAGALVVFAGCSLFDPAFGARARLELLAASAAAALATLCNPYGIGMLGLLLTTVSPARADIGEWNSIASLPPAAFVLWCVPAALLIAALWRRRASIPFSFVAVCLVVGVGAMRVARLGGFFAVAVGFFAAPYIVPEVSVRPAAGRLSPGRWAAGMGATMLLVAAATLAFGRHIVADGSWLPDRDAVSFVRSRGLHGRLFTWFNYGEYAIWQLWPSMQVSMDGRRETVYSDEVRALHWRIYANAESAPDDLARLNPDYLWLPRDLPVTGRLEHSGWHPLFVGVRSTILGRRTDATAVRSQTTPTPRYFPGP